MFLNIIILHNYIMIISFPRKVFHPEKYCKKAPLKNFETFTEEKRYDVMLYIQSKVDGSVNAGKF